MRRKFKFFISVLIGVLILFYSSLQLYGDWQTESVTTRYYKDEFKKPYYHLGVGCRIGASYYFNYNENNSFIPYILSIKLEKDIDVNEIGILFKIDTIIEEEEYTDQVRYYGKNSRLFFLFYLGVNKKIKSFIPFFEWLFPYVTIGGGNVDVEYFQRFADSAGDLYSSIIEGSGWCIGADIGVNMYLIESLLSLNSGIKYNYNFIDDVCMYNHYYRELSSKKESYILFYTGFYYFLF